MENDNIEVINENGELPQEGVDRISEPEIKADDASQNGLIKRMLSAEQLKRIHPAQDFSDGILSYGVQGGNISCIITSDKKLFEVKEAGKHGINLKGQNVCGGRLSVDTLSKWLDNKYEVVGGELFSKIHSYVKKYIYLPDEAYLDFLSLWIFGTYVFKVFRYYPYVWLNADKGSGKTLLMELLAPIAFNGDLFSNPTEAIIFREVDENLPTLFFDEIERFRSQDKEKFGAILSLLNVGYNTKGTVKRTERSTDGQFKVKSFTAYSPKMFAGINEIDSVLQDRTIRIPLIKAIGSESIERFKETPEVVALQNSIRDDLYVFSLTNGKKISDEYNGSKPVFGECGLVGRELDIWEPILLLAHIIDETRTDSTLAETMIALSQKSFAKKKSETKSDPTIAIEALLSMEGKVTTIKSEGDTRVYDSDLVLKFFNDLGDFEGVEKKNSLSKLLKQIGVENFQETVGGERKRVYSFNIKKIQDLSLRYAA